MRYAIRPMTAADAGAIARWRPDPTGHGHGAGCRAIARYEHATNGGLHAFIRMER